jgi:hypothetical protein
VSFDLGYAFHDHDELGAVTPAGRATFSSDEQAWSASARWRF